MSENVEDTRNTGSDAGEETRSAEGTVHVDAPPERVWRALTDAAELERWFPLEARVEPGEGGTIYMSWKNEFAGESSILAWDPPRHLRTSWDFGGQVTDYWIEAEEDGTRLRVVTSGFPMDAAWDDWVEGTRRGWAYELNSLKHYLERHEGEERHVVYLRRRTALPRARAWERLTGPEGIDARWLDGERLDDQPPTQIAVRLPEEGDALLRVSLEAHGPEAEGLDATVFLAAWGTDAERMDALRAEWREALERALPGGETVQ